MIGEVKIEVEMTPGIDYGDRDYKRAFKKIKTAIAADQNIPPRMKGTVSNFGEEILVGEKSSTAVVVTGTYICTLGAAWALVYYLGL